MRSQQVINEAKKWAQPVFSPDLIEQIVPILCCWALKPWLEEQGCWVALVTPCDTLWHPVTPRGSRVSAGTRREDVLLCSSDSSLWDSSCWVHSFTVLIASRFVDNFIRCLTKDNYQHNKTLKYLVLIFLCGYSVNILMQNVSEKCLRTTRQCEIPVG